MNKQAIKTLLNNSFTDFTTFIDTLSNHRFVVSPEGKWSAGQQLDHLIRSAKPVNKALGLPKFFLRFFGTPVNSTSRSYEQMKDAYVTVLGRGGVTTRPYIPAVTEAHQREILLQQMHAQRDKMIAQLDKWTEEELDKYQVPHPLLGKITVRECLYFTAYHNYHHLHTLQVREKPNQPWAEQLERALF
jgi:hypothetical protein